MRCPFVYANLRQCEGEVHQVWQKLFKTGATLIWEYRDGEWIEDPANDAVWDYACSLSRSGQHPGGLSHLHVLCSLKHDHTGAVGQADWRTKFWSLEEIENGAKRNRECLVRDQAKAAM